MIPDDNGTRALTDVLDHAVDPINQLFFHSRMLRAWGHSLGMVRHEEWLAKMRRCRTLGSHLIACGGYPPSRPARDLELGRDAGTILDSDFRQTRSFIHCVESALDPVENADTRILLERIVEEERADLARLGAWLAGEEACEPRRNQPSRLTKSGHEAVAVTAIDHLIPIMTAAVSQIFFHSMVFSGTGRADLAERELQAALRMMYRTEALLERLLDLGGLPSGSGHGALAIDGTERGADETAIGVQWKILAVLEQHLPNISGLGDPVTWAVLDGLQRATRDEAEAIATRLA